MPLTPDTPRSLALPSVIDTPGSPTKLQVLRHRVVSETNAGLGLDLGCGEGDEREFDPDPEGATRVLERLDVMLAEIQALTKRGENALATPTVVAVEPHPGPR